LEILSFDAAELGGYLGSFIWPLFRIMAFMLAAPVLGSQLVPARIRIILSVAIAILITPLLPAMPQVDGMSLASMILVGQQIVIGVCLGFFLQMVFQIFILAGQMIAMQMGLGFASMMDPTNGVNVAIVSSIYLMFATLLFITLNGHLIMLDVIVESFYSLPVSQDFSFISGGLFQIVEAISWVFSSAMIIALPAVTALLITNIAFGVMTRAAPQLNIFALGFPVALLLGLVLLWLTLDSVMDSSRSLFSDSFLILRELIRA